MNQNNIINFPKTKNTGIDFLKIEEKLRAVLEKNHQSAADSGNSYTDNQFYSKLINSLGEIQNFIFYKIESTFLSNIDRCLVFSLLIDILDTHTEYDEFVN